MEKKTATKKTQITHREATAGIGLRVIDTETGQVGRLRSVREKGAYSVGVVDFGDDSGEVWLRNMEWADGPIPVRFSMPVPHLEALQAIAQSQPRKSFHGLFKTFFGRAPSADELRIMKGEARARV